MYDLVYVFYADGKWEGPVAKNKTVPSDPEVHLKLLFLFGSLLFASSTVRGGSDRHPVTPLPWRLLFRGEAEEIRVVVSGADRFKELGLVLGGCRSSKEGDACSGVLFVEVGEEGGFR